MRTIALLVSLAASGCSFLLIERKPEAQPETTSTEPEPALPPAPQKTRQVFHRTCVRNVFPPVVDTVVSAGLATAMVFIFRGAHSACDDNYGDDNWCELARVGGYFLAVDAAAAAVGMAMSANYGFRTTAQCRDDYARAHPSDEQPAVE